MVLARLAPCRELFIGAAVELRRRFHPGDLSLACMPGEFIVGLDEQPRFRLFSGSRLHPNQMPTPVEPGAVERKREVPFCKPLLRIALRRPSAAIPNNHRAGTIFSLRNIALKIEIVDR